MRRCIVFALAALVCAAAGAQGPVQHGSGDPRTLVPQPNCNSRFYIDDSTQKLYVAATGSPCQWKDEGAPSIGSKMRAALSGATNPNLVPAMTVPPSWAGSTVYALAQVVANGSNYYICLAGGTSAASGGPTGTGDAPITDGGVTWLWYAVPPVASTSPLAPTITGVSSVGGTLTLGFPMSVSQVIQPQFRAVAAKVASCSSNAYTQCINGLTGSGNTALANPETKISFYTDAPKFVIDDCMNAPSILVDGVQALYGRVPSTFSGGHCYTQVDFSSSGGRRTRLIDLYWTSGGGVVTLGTVWVDPVSKVWAPNVPASITACWFGDSTIAGGNAQPIGGFDWLPDRTAAMLGWTGGRNFGIGGTGYTASWTYLQHISDLTTYGPCDAVVFWGMINDGTTAPAVEQAKVLATLQAARAQVPTAPIFVFGAYPAATGPSASMTNMETAASAAVNQFGDPNTFFLPVISDSGGSWISGTGKVTAPTGTGNADFCASSDGTHPTDNCIVNLLALRIASAIKGAIQNVQ